MMGDHARQNELWSEPVNLARRIPADHPLRKLRETLKLDFVREEAAGCYGRKGIVSVDPVIVMKMMLLLFWDNVRSERELMRIVPAADRLSLVFGLQPGGRDPQSQRALQGAAGRWARQALPGSFARVWAECLEAGRDRGVSCSPIRAWCEPTLRSIRSSQSPWPSWRRARRRNRPSEAAVGAVLEAGRSISGIGWRPILTLRSCGKQAAAKVIPVTDAPSAG